MKYAVVNRTGQHLSGDPCLALFDDPCEAFREEYRRNAQMGVDTEQAMLYAEAVPEHQWDSGILDEVRIILKEQV